MTRIASKISADADLTTGPASVICNPTEQFEGGCRRPYLSEVTGFSFAVGDEQNQQREWPEGEIGLRGQSLALGLTLIAAPQLGEGSRLNVEWLR